MRVKLFAGFSLALIFGACSKRSSVEISGLYQCEANLSAALVDTALAADTMIHSSVPEILRTIPESEKRCPICGKEYSFNPDRKLWVKGSIDQSKLAVICNCAHSSRSKTKEYIGVKFDNSLVRSPDEIVLK